MNYYFWVYFIHKGPQWRYPLSSSMIGGVVASGANTLNSYVSGNHVGPVNGVIARMAGISSNQPTGTGWDIAIGVSSNKYLDLWNYHNLNDSLRLWLNFIQIFFSWFRVAGNTFAYEEDKSAEFRYVLSIIPNDQEKFLMSMHFNSHDSMNLL